MFSFPFYPFSLPRLRGYVPLRPSSLISCRVRVVVRHSGSCHHIAIVTRASSSLALHRTAATTFPLLSHSSDLYIYSLGPLARSPYMRVTAGSGGPTVLGGGVSKASVYFRLLSLLPLYCLVVVIP